MAIKLSISLWIQGSVQEALAYYTRIFPEAKVGQSSASVGTFSFGGMSVVLLGDGMERPTMALSTVVQCDTSQELNHIWNGFLEEGQAAQCGWIQDKYGFSWQVVPKALNTWLSHPQFGSENMERMRSMVKLDEALFLK
ncbi:MAG: VOC family protein [Schleiferiaceae bacterium]|nr:VOC family protein [Schleiferiaceae bacterium]